MKSQALCAMMLVALTLMLLVMLSPTPVFAATCVWTGAVSTDWTTAGNWMNCGGGVPGSLDTAVIEPATNNPVVSTVTTVGTVIINNGGALTVNITTTVGTVTINSGGVLTYSASTGVTFRINNDFNINDGGKYVHDRAALVPIQGANRNFSDGSTVEIRQFWYPQSDLPAFGNLVVNNLGIVQFSGHLTSVKGNLVKQNSGELRLATDQSVNLSVGGNFDIQGGTITIQSEQTSNTANVSVNGIISIASASTLQRGSKATGLWSFNVAGDWTNQGTFTAGNSTVAFNGSSAQSIGGTNATTFNNLTINNASGVTMNNNATVNGVLTLTSGDLNTGGNTLTLGSSATVAGTGDVVGNVQRAHTFNANTNYQFNNTQTLINFSSVTNVTSPSIVINLSTSAPLGLTTAIPRVYAITATDISNYNATLQLGYKDSETAGMTEANLRAWRYDGSRWVLQVGGVDTTSNYVSATNVTTFSDWAITDNGAPTAVTLSSFDARADAPNALPFVGLGALALIALGAGAWWRGRK